MQGVYHQFALLLAVAAAVGIIALRLRQPLLVAYIVVGILLGPSALGWVTRPTTRSTCWRRSASRCCCSWSA